MLIKCPECELQVSDKALSCPHCGYPLQDGAPSAKPIRTNQENKKPSHKKPFSGYGYGWQR